MKVSFRISVEVPDIEFGRNRPTREDVRKFLQTEALFSGGQFFPGGDEDPHPDWEFVLYRHGCVKVV